jgi:signal peptidase I
MNKPSPFETHIPQLPENIEKNQNKEAPKTIVDSWYFMLVVCITIAILFRSLVFEPFHIPSGSMKPTLLTGDYIFVSKSSYGYSRFSFPLGLRIFEGRINARQPERGDVIVFRPKNRSGIDYIKRLIGLPGDSIQYKRSELYINGKKIPRTRIEDFVEKKSDGTEVSIPQYIETLPEGKSYRTLDKQKDGMLDDTPEFIVPPGAYFMMGDNRDESADSRTETVNFVPFENLVGRADRIFLSSSDDLWKLWKLPLALRFKRLGLSLAPANSENNAKQ